MLTVLPSGEVKFEIVLSDARSVELLGDFTQWESKPISMTFNGEGKWLVQLRISPGEHLFKYRIDGWHWLADFAAHGVEMNDFDSWNSQLFIPQRSTLDMPSLNYAKAA
jgi:1,4-alpha-glucan branching enzyme